MLVKDTRSLLTYFATRIKEYQFKAKLVFYNDIRVIGAVESLLLIVVCFTTSLPITLL